MSGGPKSTCSAYYCIYFNLENEGFFPNPPLSSPTPLMGNLMPSDRNVQPFHPSNSPPPRSVQSAKPLGIPGSLMIKEKKKEENKRVRVALPTSQMWLKASPHYFKIWLKKTFILLKIKIGNLTEALNAMQDFLGRILSPVFLWNIRNIKKWINNKKQIKERRTTLFIFTYVSDILKKEKKKKTVFMLNWSDSQYIHISQRAQSHFAVEKSSHFSRSYPGNLSTWAKKPLGLDKLRHALSVMTARNKQRQFLFF